MCDKTLQNIRRSLRALLFLISPLMIIGCIIAVLVLVTGYGEHRQMLRRMTAHGLETTAGVDFPPPDNDWVHLTYTDREGNERFSVLEMAYYPATEWRRMTPGTPLNIRYLPLTVAGSDRVLLADRIDDVIAYHGYLSHDALVLLAICWLVVVLEPQWLYIGLIDKDELFGNQFV